MHYKRDGTLDMRYSSSKAAMSSGFGMGSFGSSGGSNYSPMSSGFGIGSFGSSRNTGFSSMSYGSTASSALHHKKDGTLDMRYSSSRSTAFSAQPIHVSRPVGSFEAHHKKDGTLDMRYNSSKIAATSTQSNYINRPTSSSELHYKKDGTMDMRYNSSKTATPCSTLSTYANRPSSSSGLHHKKDGTLDMRYSSSKNANQSVSSSGLHHKKDGTLDMRYASSKNAMSRNASGYQYSKQGIPKHIPMTKSGIPDMRTTAAKDWVRQQAQTGIEEIPSWIPKTKDGSLDTSKAITQEYLKWKGTTLSNYVPGQRLAYYDQKLEDMQFRNLVEDAREDEVEMPQYEMLPETPEMQHQLCPQPTRHYNTRQDDYDNDDNSQYDTLRDSSEDQHHYPSRTTRNLSRQDQRPYSSQRMMNSSREDYEYDIRSEVSESIPVINYRDLNINLDDKLGQGSFGIVYKGEWNHQIVAIKQLHLNRLTRQEKNSFVKEIKIMSTLGEHTNLVHLFGYTLEPPCLIMEYVELGSLTYLLHYCEDQQIEAKITDGRIKKKLILGIVLGMNQLHAVNIVHGDLKPQNILVSNDYIAKITDFGFATLRGKSSSSVASSITSNDDDGEVRGTAGYMAPELLNSSNPPECSIDVYSFGIVLNEIIQEEEPYADQFQNFLGRGPFAAVNHARLGNRPRINATTPSFFKNFIKKCWDTEPRNRPTFKQIFHDLKPSHINLPDSFQL
ncbi:unnamed protein product [Adineta steineri]|uniref:Protein kinase domain-containing protein n=1 Tax=Adineta steineri TaxID=433720 RepID=A0A815C3F0_9BILA|nr:unnamed protein product [Adineta steineri]CAF3808533.1 unnamed protein product [Adineta steineri]